MRLAAFVVMSSLGCSETPHEIAARDLSSEEVDFGADLEPLAGRVLHGWGQFSGAWTRDLPAGAGDSDDLAEYEATVAPSAPAMLSFYVAPVESQIEALLPKLARIRRDRGDYVVLLGLYFHSLQDEVAGGERDAELAALAAGLRELELPVLLRIGYEFNNPWQAYAPGVYVRAFRRIARMLADAGACNVVPVWHASTLGLGRGSPEPWYPGDDVVGWWGLSLFHWQELVSPELEAFLDSARRRRHPVVVAEAAPVLSSRVPFRVRGPRSEREAERWYRSLFELLRRRPEIKGLSLIAVDWRRLRADLPGFGWPDTRLGRWPAAGALVRQELSSERYVHLGEATYASLANGPSAQPGRAGGSKTGRPTTCSRGHPAACSTCGW